jgi:hypothetical protein
MRDRRRAKGKLVGSVGDVKVVVISMEHHLRNDRTRETRAIDEEDEEVRSRLSLSRGLGYHDGYQDTCLESA